jgi:lysophospholipid acyltransferase (LPLAT)-like uncharacterized protein
VISDLQRALTPRIAGESRRATDLVAAAGMRRQAWITTAARRRLLAEIAPRGRFRRRWTTGIGAAVARAVVDGIFATSRERVHDGGPLFDRVHAGPQTDRPVILVAWHNAILGLVRFAYKRIVAAGHPAVPIVSNSRDGDLIARIAESFGHNVHVVRGSSKRGGADAMRRLRQLLDHGISVILTVDGPRGPRYQAKPGAVQLAAATGAPIVPMNWATTAELRIRPSWDEFRIPLPAGTIDYLIGEPFTVAASSDTGYGAPREVNRLNERLGELTRRADALTLRKIGLGRSRGTTKVSSRDAPAASS